MVDMAAITVGMPAFGMDNRPLGVVEATDNDVLTIGTHHFPRAAVERVEAGTVHLRIAASALSARPDHQDVAAIGDNTAAGEQLTIPIAEERLAVGTRTVELGEIELRKRVVEETIMQPVTVRREVVEVVQRDAEGREIGAQELPPLGATQSHPQ